MNNKLIKLVAVVVLSVMALGTCAFASTITDAGYSHSSTAISFTLTPAEGAEQMTYVAYAGSTGGTIVAIDQVASTATAQNVTIDSSKLADATQIVINSGDDKSNTSSQVVLPLAEVKVFDAVFKNKDNERRQVVVNGETYQNVPLFSLKIEKLSDTAKTLSIDSLVAKAESQGIENVLTVTEGAIPRISGKGEIVVDNIYLIGAPAEFLTAEDATIVPTWSLN